MVDNVTERMLTAVPSRHGCDLDTLRECIEAIQTVTQVTLACADARLAEQVVDELTNHADQVLVSTQVVPVERVRLIKRVVTEQTVVTGQVRSEHVDVDITAPPASPTP